MNDIDQVAWRLELLEHDATAGPVGGVACWVVHGPTLPTRSLLSVRFPPPVRHASASRTFIRSDPIRLGGCASDRSANETVLLI